MLRAGRHAARRLYPGIGGREVLLSVASIGLAVGIAGGAILADRTTPAEGLAPTGPPTLPTVAAATSTTPTTRPELPPSRPLEAPGAAQTTSGSSAPPTTLGPPGATQAPPAAPPVTTVGETTTTRPCRKVILHTRPHITVVVCIPIRK